MKTLIGLSKFRIHREKKITIAFDHQVLFIQKRNIGQPANNPNLQFLYLLFPPLGARKEEEEEKEIILKLNREIKHSIKSL